MSTIFVPNLRAQFEAYRRHLKSQLGQRYESSVQPYRTILVMSSLQNDTKGTLEIARGLAGLMKARGKLTSHVHAAIMSAALDVVERHMVEDVKNSRPRTPTPDDLPDDLGDPSQN
jgi:hypothetical protein